MTPSQHTKSDDITIAGNSMNNIECPFVIKLYSPTRRRSSSALAIIAYD